MKQLALQIHAYGLLLLMANGWFWGSLVLWMQGIPQAAWRACATFLPITQELPLILVTLTISISLVFGLAFGLAYLTQYWRHLNRLSKAKFALCWVKGGSSLWVTQEENISAYTIGFFKKQIVITSGLRSKLSPKQLEAVWLHEHYHASHNHIWVSFLAKLTPYLLFFVPFIKDISEHLLLLLESSADEFVIGAQGTDRHLKRALVYALEGNQNRVGVHFSGKLLSERIEVLSGSPAYPNRLMKLKVSLVLFLMMYSSVLLLQSPPDKVVASNGSECSLPSLDLTLFSPLPRASFPFSTAR